MCRIEGCERHEFNNGLCLTHIKDADAPVEKKKRSRKKKVDAVELTTTDATEVAEERNTEEND